MKVRLIDIVAAGQRICTYYYYSFVAVSCAGKELERVFLSLFCFSLSSK